MPPGSPERAGKPDCSSRSTSSPRKLLNCTPYSGPPGVFLIGWGKWSWMMNRAVRGVNAFSLLWKNAAVRARAEAARTSCSISVSRGTAVG